MPYLCIKTFSKFENLTKVEGPFLIKLGLRLFFKICKVINLANKIEKLFKFTQRKEKFQNLPIFFVERKKKCLKKKINQKIKKFDHSLPLFYSKHVE
jgi:hypothetical protein